MNISSLILNLTVDVRQIISLLIQVLLQPLFLLFFFVSLRTFRRRVIS